MALKTKHAKDVAKPDEFVSTSMRAIAWLETRRTKVLAALGVLVALGVAYTVWADQRKSAAADAGRLLATALEAETAEVIAEPPQADEDGEEPPLTFRSEKQRAQTVIRRYKRLLARVDSGNLAAHAHMGLAGAYLELGKLQDAQREYQRVLESGSEPLAPYAIEGIAYVLEARGKLGEARARYDELRLLQEGAYRNLAAYHLARIDMAQGKKPEALELLKNVRQNLPESPDLPYLREQIEARIADLEAEGVIAASGGDDDEAGEGRSGAKKGKKKGGGSRSGSRAQDEDEG
ncbi:MAG: tetratricopeptide repeat protein [Deltaproteobacteria bacterium]|nr:tetratricopeptide repeat protein [Deltaproteobacteria bacterium]